MDCVRFAAAVWDELAGLPEGQGAAQALPRLPQDSGLHSGAMVAAAQCLRVLGRFHALAPVQPDDQGTVRLMPGDMLEARLTPQETCCGGPGHVLIAGPAAHRTYHAAIGSGVIVRGLPPVGQVFHVWRPKDYAAWLRSSSD